MAWLRALLSAIFVCAVAPAQSVPVLQIDANGILTGATGVDVNGTLFDVVFQDGRCTDLFSGCDNVADFAFQNAADATAAMQVLLDTVFVDSALGSFDSLPQLTRGCDFILACATVTPYGVISPLLVGAVAGNQIFQAGDSAFAPAILAATDDTSGSTSINFAVFSPSAVPEPESLLLVATGLALLGVHRRNARRRKAWIA